MGLRNRKLETLLKFQASGNKRIRLAMGCNPSKPEKNIGGVFATLSSANDGNDIEVHENNYVDDHDLDSSLTSESEPKTYLRDDYGVPVNLEDEERMSFPRNISAELSPLFWSQSEKGNSALISGEQKVSIEPVPQCAEEIGKDRDGKKVELCHDETPALVAEDSAGATSGSGVISADDDFDDVLSNNSTKEKSGVASGVAAPTSDVATASFDIEDAPMDSKPKPPSPLKVQSEELDDPDEREQRLEGEGIEETSKNAILDLMLAKCFAAVESKYVYFSYIISISLLFACVFYLGPETARNKWQNDVSDECRRPVAVKESLNHGENGTFFPQPIFLHATVLNDNHKRILSPSEIFESDGAMLSSYTGDVEPASTISRDDGVDSNKHVTTEAKPNNIANTRELDSSANLNTDSRQTGFLGLLREEMASDFMYLML